MRPAANPRIGLVAQESFPVTQALLVRRLTGGFLRHWLLSLNMLLFAYVSVPWLAPVLMKSGQVSAARAIYGIYSTQCHQLPQRSFFLYGAQPSYSLSEIRAAWQATEDPFALRQFIGNTQMGWKVAWSDRMVSMYISMFVAGLVFVPLRRRLRPLLLWAFVLLVLPMALDGSSHFISDLAGIGSGFRDSNAWLAALTGNSFPSWFYAGDALGSFNSWMRLLTGLLFGVAVVGLAYPYLEQFATQARGLSASRATARWSQI